MKNANYYIAKETLQRCRQAVAIIGNENWDDFPKTNKRKAVQKNINRIEDVLRQGLDIGTIIERRISVRLVNDRDHGLCFQSEKDKTLYPVFDNIR